MRSWRAKLNDDCGNALIEFVFLFCTALVFMIVATAQVELEIKRHAAAFAIANEALRTWQLTQDQSSAIVAAGLTAETFDVRANSWQVKFEDLCGSASRQVVSANVSEVSEVAVGYC